MRVRWLLVTALIWTACSSGEITSPIGPGASDAPVLVGAGDIGVCGSNGAVMTGRLVANEPGTVFVAGDLAYPHGTTEQFRDCYDPVWGAQKSRTRPAPGNHEYESAGAIPYFNYFGSLAGPHGLGYFRYQKASWHIYSLNSNVEAGNRASQLNWLAGDLETQPAICTVAYFHHPLFSSGEHGLMPSAPVVRDLWQTLHAAGVEIVIAAHEHFYERFAPQDHDGRLDHRFGIRQFIVGTGGAALRQPVRRVANSEAAFSVFGVLRLTLEPASYRWEFLTAEGGSVLDSGVGQCHGRPQ